eukprot:1153266-Pelagomonas_calceolata.AAC.1
MKDQTTFRNMQIKWLSNKLEWSAGGLRSTRNRPPPNPGPSRVIHRSMLMKFVSTGGVPGARMGASDQLLSAAKHDNMSFNSSHSPRGHQNLESPQQCHDVTHVSAIPKCDEHTHFSNNAMMDAKTWRAHTCQHDTSACTWPPPWCESWQRQHTAHPTAAAGRPLMHGGSPWASDHCRTGPGGPAS